MRSHWTSLLSAFGVPLLGLGGLLVTLWHPNLSFKPAADEQAMIFLLDPNPRQDPSLTICLRQQAKEVVRCRERETASYSTTKARWPGYGLAQAIDDYNLVAKECTPAVFQATGLPPSLKQ